MTKEENDKVKSKQGRYIEEIKVELQVIVNNEVKNWREKQEEAKINLEQIMQQQREYVENAENDVTNLILSKEDIIRDTAEKKDVTIQ